MNLKSLLCLSVFTIVYFSFSGCTSQKEVKNDLIQIEVNSSYQEKEIKLEEVADIEYLQLELNDDYLFANEPHIVTSDKIIISRDGEVLVFSREGNPLLKFDRKGNGPGEYAYIEQLMYDEISDEIFIKYADKIIAYSSKGEYKRTIPLLGIIPNVFSQIVNYDSETFLIFDSNNVYTSPFSFISKKDGAVVDSIITSKGEPVMTYSFSDDFLIFSFQTFRIVKYGDGHLLSDFSVDTVYFLSKSKKLSPVLTRTPQIRSMDPVIYLNSFAEAGNFEFVSTVRVENEGGRLPVTYLMRDKTTGSVFRQKITINDYKEKLVNLSPKTIANTNNSKLGFITLNLDELKEANRENKLSGKLKEIVEKSSEEGNDVYMLLHFK